VRPSEFRIIGKRYLVERRLDHRESRSILRI
jgi:hypothetical protein